MLCGIGSFSSKRSVDDDPWAPSLPSSPKKAKSKKESRNPYASRGLDKFSSVLSELEARREKIMARAAPQGADDVMVWFMQSGTSQGWIPIVVKLKGVDGGARARQNARKSQQLLLPASPPPPPAMPARSNSVAVKEPGSPAGAKEGPKGPEPALPEAKGAKSYTFSCGDKGAEISWKRCFSRPSFYWPLVMVLILLCFATFGRVFAICCTSVWWYAMPDLREESYIRRPAKKKDYGRRLSDRRIGGHVVAASRPSSPAKFRVGGGVQEGSSPKAHASGKRVPLP